MTGGARTECRSDSACAFTDNSLNNLTIMKKNTIDGLHALLKDGQVDQCDAISSGQQPCRAQRQWYARTDRPLLSIRRSAHELVGHSIPAVISPSDYDSRMDGLAVTSENIIRKETMSPLGHGIHIRKMIGLSMA